MLRTKFEEPSLSVTSNETLWIPGGSGSCEEIHPRGVCKNKQCHISTVVGDDPAHEKGREEKRGGTKKEQRVCGAGEDCGRSIAERGGGG